MNTENNVTALPRSQRDWVTPEAPRALIKKNTGYNARQVTVKTSSSGTRYLSVTVRDAKVNLEKLNTFLAPFNTWTMDQTDYVEGQSINVHLTEEVKAELASGFIEEIKAAVTSLVKNDNAWITLSNGLHLNRSHDGREYWISTADGVDRAAYGWGSDTEAFKESAIAHLAFGAAIVGKKRIR